MKWLQRWRDRRECFHHDHYAGTSWVTWTLVDLGRRKMWTCSGCGRMWVT